MDKELEQSEIVTDEPCEKCGYNLRGLRTGQRCPECGRLIHPVFPYDPVDAETSEARRREPLQPIADELRFPLDAVAFVADAVAFIAARAVRAGRRKPSFSAQEFAWGMRDFALEEFGDPSHARETLMSWELKRSEDVGAIMFALVKAKIVEVEPGDRVEDFNGLFVVETLFAG